MATGTSTGSLKQFGDAIMATLYGEAIMAILRLICCMIPVNPSSPVLVFLSVCWSRFREVLMRPSVCFWVNSSRVGR